MSRPIAGTLAEPICADADHGVSRPAGLRFHPRCFYRARRRRDPVLARTDRGGDGPSGALTGVIAPGSIRPAASKAPIGDTATGDGPSARPCRALRNRRRCSRGRRRHRDLLSLRRYPADTCRWRRRFPRIISPPSPVSADSARPLHPARRGPGRRRGSESPERTAHDVPVSSPRTLSPMLGDFNDDLLTSVRDGLRRI